MQTPTDIERHVDLNSIRTINRVVEVKLQGARIHTGHLHTINKSFSIIAIDPEREVYEMINNRDIEWVKILFD